MLRFAATIFISAILVGVVCGQGLEEEYKQTAIKTINSGLQGLAAVAKTMQEAGDGFVRAIPAPAGIVGHNVHNRAGFDPNANAACRRPSTTPRPLTTLVG